MLSFHRIPQPKPGKQPGPTHFTTECGVGSRTVTARKRLNLAKLRWARCVWGGLGGAAWPMLVIPSSTEAAQAAVSRALLPLQQTLPLEQTLGLCPPGATAVHWIWDDHSREKESSRYFGLCLSGATDTFPAHQTSVSTQSPLTSALPSFGTKCGRKFPHLNVTESAQAQHTRITL